MTSNMERAEAIHNQLARGTIALALLEEISEHVADYDSSKAAADAIYAGKVNDAMAALASRIAGSVRRANAALETLGKDDDDDDYDDD